MVKIHLFRDQFETSPKNLEYVKILAEYVTMVHAPYFLQSPLVILAPRQDREFWVVIMKYQTCFDEGDIQYEMLESVLRIMQMNHLWYFTEELVIFGLFNDEKSKAMTESLSLNPRPRHFKPGTLTSNIYQSNENYSIGDCE